MNDDNPVLFARQETLASQLRQASALIDDSAQLMEEYEREHSEDLFDELRKIGSRVRQIAGYIQRGQEWSCP